MPDPYITGPHAAQILAQQGLAERKRSAVLPAGVIDDTIPRDRVVAGVIIPSGTLLLLGLVMLRARQGVTALGSRTWSTLFTTPTAQWMCIVRQSDLAVLAKTEDKTNEAWAANADKTFTVTGGPYVPTADTLAYIGLAAAHNGTATIGCASTASVSLQGVAPILAGTSTTGLTTPSSLGATAAAITATANVYRGWYQ